MEPYFASMAGAGRPASARTFAPRLSAPTWRCRAWRSSSTWPDLIDLDAEIGAKREEGRSWNPASPRKRKKLENENFVRRAPAAVVQKERDVLKDLEEQLATIVAVLEKYQRLLSARVARP